MESEDQNRDDLISNFCSITGVEATRGQFYLESSQWNLQLAIQTFFESSDELPTNSVIPLDAEMIPSEANVGQNAAQEQLLNTESFSKEVQKESKPKTSSKFATLDSLRQREDSGASSEEEGQAFYAGGSERSGQQVLGPKKKKNAEELVTDMFKSAKEKGAEVVDPQEHQRRPKPSSAFMGTGFKLGSATETSTPVSTSSTQRRENIEMVLKLWKNGFSLDDGQLRHYEDPRNAEFLSSVRNGEIPLELIRKFNGQEVHLNMEDHKNEEYVEQKKRFEAFSGAGHRLGSL